MATDDDASQFMLVPHRKSLRLISSVRSTVTGGPPLPPPSLPHREPAKTPLATQPEESHNPQPENKSKAKLRALPNPRRSLRLKCGSEGSLTFPEAQAHRTEPAKTSSASGKAKIFFGPNPSWAAGAGAHSLPPDSANFVASAHSSPNHAEDPGHVLGGSTPLATQPEDSHNPQPPSGKAKLRAMPNTRRFARLNPGVLTKAEAQAHTPGPRGPVMSSGPELTPTRASLSGLAPSTDSSLSSGTELTPTRAAPTGPPPSMGSAEQSQTATPDTENPRAGDPAMHDHSSDHESESGPSILDDDGSRRCRLRRPLHCCPEAFTASGQELDESADAAKGKGKGKRKRNKGKSAVRAGRGLGRPRDPVRPEERSILRVVADGVFATTAYDTKYITTI